MNGRTVFAVNRSPVIAWNVEAPQPQPLPYAADMPAAAAAAISPVVSPADPYARCWQSQVDAGSGFSYFGALYNNSLPPTAYRLQPGCMANLGQFWPPTPPPDGCGRFDGSNLYLGPHVFRQGENIPPHLRNSYQSLGHYPHIVETPKDTNQRSFKRETPLSPNAGASSLSAGPNVSKSENLNYCVIDSKLKSQGTASGSLPKQELTATSSHESYLCGLDSRGSSTLHPSTDKACYLSSCSLNSLNFHSSSQDNAHKAKSVNGSQENCNASPLKNVYFSSYESENVNSIHSKHFNKSSDEQFHYQPRSVSLDVNKPTHLDQSVNNFYLLNGLSKKADVGLPQELLSTNSLNRYRAEKYNECVTIAGEYQARQKSSSHRVKSEKLSHSDCKYQKSKTGNMHQAGDRTPNDVFNIPTSVVPSKIDSNDKYFLPSCSSTAPSCIASSYSTSSPYLYSKDYAADLRTSASYRNMVHPSSCSLSKPWHVNEVPLVSPEAYFKTSEAAKPPVPSPLYKSSPLHESVISVAQTAPQDMDLKVNGKMRQSSQLPKKVQKESYSDDDEVQIIGVQMKNNASTKHVSRQSAEQKPVSSPIALVPVNLKSEVLPEVIEIESSEDSLEKAEKDTQWIKTELEPPTLEKEDINSDVTDCSVEDKQQPELPLMKDVSEENIKVKSIKKEIVLEQELPEKCDTFCKTEENIFKAEEANIKPSDTSETCDAKANCCSLNTSMPDIKSEVNSVPAAEYNDNHNLNLLLNTIEKVTSLELSHNIVVKSEPSPEAEASEEPLPTFPDRPKTCGLDLLSVIAGQRLVAEFESQNVSEEDVKSNYPVVKTENKSVCDDKVKQSSLDTSSALKSSVFEMQDRLVELQKKYKQKQKELSRLKPKKRLATSYLNGRRKSLDYSSDASKECKKESLDLNASTTSNEEISVIALDSEKYSEPNCKNVVEESKGVKRKFQSRKKEASLPLEKRITRHSSSKILSVKCDDDSSSANESPRKITRSSIRNKLYHLRRSKNAADNALDDEVQIISVNEDSNKNEPDKSAEAKSTKSYTLRKSPQNKKQESSISSSNTGTLKAITSKRKSDNPRKYMPSKQSKLSETIIAKQLRSRILFDTSSSLSDDEKSTKDGGVPEELYDALMKCHLGDQKKNKELPQKKSEKQGVLGSPEPTKLKLHHLNLKQRLLALEDGLFYAGFIKEIQAPDRYGIALDGQRGNRLHIFTQEELLAQTIVESKPLSSELPEGTRVCAYWSQQYRCLYPGIVGKAPCPSADWSEPRVFVLFDDGDSGQIPTKNIRLIPPDIISAENDQEVDSASENSSSDSKQDNKIEAGLKSSSKVSSPKDCDTSNENESKDSSCASVNDSSCDDSCFLKYLSTSQSSENYSKVESGGSLSSITKQGKHQRKHSKRKVSSRTKLKDQNEGKEAKSKRHKKYKDKHRRHHHHHHHRHHHHHHRHSKKHKHKKKNGKSQSTEKNLIPCSITHKSFKSFQVEAESACTDHSSTLNLPQT